MRARSPATVFGGRRPRWIPPRDPREARPARARSAAGPRARSARPRTAWPGHWRSRRTARPGAGPPGRTPAAGSRRRRGSQYAGAATRAAPGPKPNRPIAAAIASAKNPEAPYQCAGAGDAVLFAERPVEQIGGPRVEQGLDEDGRREHRDDERPARDLPALEGEQTYPRVQQRAGQFLGATESRPLGAWIALRRPFIRTGAAFASSMRPPLPYGAPQAAG